MVSTNVAELLKQLTLEEKVSLLSGADIWQTHEISRLGIGSIKTTDGPAGARGKQLVDGLPAAFVPAAVCQAATWSKSDLRGLGRLLCRETKTKASQVLLAPTICCARNPLGGRNFECFGEDPFLSGSLAVEYVGGLQETGEVSATPKHFVANEQEYKRISIDAVISETVLREIYLRPFEMVIKSASPPGCIMTSYNLVNGHHMDANARILKDILRGEWGFQGLVMSDWGGTTSTIDSVVAGLDLEMPGPPEHRGEQLLRAAKESLEVLAAVDAHVTNLLTLLRTHDLLGLAPGTFSQQRERIFETTAPKQNSYASLTGQLNSLKSSASPSAFLDHHGDLVAPRGGLARRIPRARHATWQIPQGSPPVHRTRERPARSPRSGQSHGHGRTIPRQQDPQYPRPRHRTRRAPNGENRIEDRGGKHDAGSQRH
ncbi:hypothetical protein FALCPG4_018780 [Fusarium falciforme]